MKKLVGVCDFALSVLVIGGSMCLAKWSFAENDILWVLLLEAGLFALFAIYQRWCFHKKALPSTLKELLASKVSFLGNIELYYFALCRFLFADVSTSVSGVLIVNIIMTMLVGLNGHSRDATCLVACTLGWFVLSASLEPNNECLADAIKQ